MLELIPKKLNKIILIEKFEKAPTQPAKINLINWAEKYCKSRFLRKEIKFLGVFTL